MICFPNMRRPALAGLLTLATVIPLAGPRAEGLVVAVAAETNTIDPHFSIVNSSVTVTRHVFDPLVRQDARQRLLPGLATSWTAVSETEWEFHLRPGVRFHNGQELTAEDVAFSLHRAATLPNTVSGFAIMTRQITGMRVVDPLTIRLSTNHPFPLMAEHLSAVGIVSRAVAEGAEPKDFNSGRAAIGTGPYRFLSWTPGGAVRLARNDSWWDRSAPWATVTIRPIPDGAARVAALLSGAVDIIGQVPGNALPVLRTRADIGISQTLSNRVSYLLINHAADAGALMHDPAGAPLGANPLRDRRVRLALSKAINRDVLAMRVLEGAAAPAGQMLPPGHVGVSPQLRPEAYDPDGARQLLAEAGYPDGFGLVLLIASNRDPGDQPVGEAVGQMLARVGIRASIEVMPYSISTARLQKGDYSLMLRGWGTETGEVSMAIRALFATRDAAPGWGTFNRSGYSNPALDAALNVALTEFDAGRREELLQRASEEAAADLPVIPLYFHVASWAFRSGIGYPARSDNYTFAWEVWPAVQR